MEGPCEHCGNADKSKWLSQCMYKGDWPSRRAFVLSTFDPPCACDAYEEGQRELARSSGWWALLWLIGVAAVLAGVFWLAHAHARDLGQWEKGDPAIREWYQGLKMPDVPNASCCGEADAYWCDKINIKDGKTFCTITDDRPDAPLGRPHVDVGAEIEIPNHKLKWDEGNPTGHAIVFLSTSGFVYCFVQAGGV